MSSTTPDGTTPSIDEQRAQLRSTVFEDSHKYRILFLGQFFQGPTGIVASLCRALESVGHWVFRFDLSRHKNILDKSHGGRGGFGPVFVQWDELRPVLDRYRPEVVVLCAGGMVLTEQDAAMLRERGIVTVGLTLSDPDVEESIAPWAGNFDFHATNAMRSYENYVERGHAHTLLMPFGIDREFVLHDVPDDASLEADAICIGHANGRVERHAVMLRLAEELSVRVYGSGWPIEGAVPVSGDRLLQAARAGTFHVNFPRTRAGFTNVKCGMFESIGAGGVLCTEEFPEMGRLFEYDDEVIGYRDGDDLARKLRTLVENPDRVEEIRRRGFRRLVTEHLYEHRWLALFREIRSMIAEDPSAEDRLVRLLDDSRGRPRNVVISGYFGAKNLGDDILLEALAQGIEDRVDDARVVVAAARPLDVERQQGFPAFLRTSPGDAAEWAARTSSVILGPGGLWHDYTIGRAQGVAGIVNGAQVSPAHLVQLPLMVKAFGGSFHGFGLGVGPLGDESARATVRLSVSLADSVVVRDVESLRLVDALNDNQTLTEQAPDAAYGLPITVPSTHGDPERGGRRIGLNLRPWDGEGAVVERLGHALARLAMREPGLTIVPLAMQPTDAKAIADFVKRFGLEERTPDVALPATADELVDLLRDVDGVVSMRLHLNLFAHRCGVSAVGIAYDPKLVAHFNELRREEWLLSMDATDEMVEVALDKLAHEPVVDRSTMDQVKALETQAQDALDRLAKRVADSPVLTGLGVGMRRGAEGSATGTANEVAHPLGWTPSTILDLRGARLAAHGEAGELPAYGRVSRSTVKVGLDVRAPTRGDEAFASIVVPRRLLGTSGTRIEVVLRPHYKENRKFAGRMAYFMRVDGQELFEHDATAWNENESVWIGVPSGRTSVRIEIGVRALRNCEPWGWGRATPITIRGIRSLPWDSAAPGIVWGCSNPFATVPDAVDEKPSQPSVATVAQPTVRPAVPRATRYRRALRRRARRVLRYLGLVD